MHERKLESLFRSIKRDLAVEKKILQDWAKKAISEEEKKTKEI